MGARAPERPPRDGAAWVWMGPPEEVDTSLKAKASGRCRASLWSPHPSLQGHVTQGPREPSSPPTSSAPPAQREGPPRAPRPPAHRAHSQLSWGWEAAPGTEALLTLPREAREGEEGPGPLAPRVARTRPPSVPQAQERTPTGPVWLGLIFRRPLRRKQHSEQTLLWSVRRGGAP